MSSVTKIEPRRLDPPKVVAPVIGARPHFKIIGSNFSSSMYVYACRNLDGTDEVSEVKIDQDASAISTDRQWCVLAKPDRAAKAEDLYVAIKLNDKFQGAVPGLKVVV